MNQPVSKPDVKPEKQQKPNWKLEIEEFEFAGCMLNNNAGAPNGVVIT